MKLCKTQLTHGPKFELCKESSWAGVRSSLGHALARPTMFVVSIVWLTDGCIYRAWPHILLVGNLKTKTVTGKNQTQTWFMILPPMSQYYWRLVKLSQVCNIFLNCLHFSSDPRKSSNLWKCKQTMLLEWTSPVSRVLLKPQYQARVGTALVICDKLSNFVE